MQYVCLSGLSWLLLAVSLLTLASAHARVRHCDCKQCNWASAFAQSMCLQPTNMSTLHTHVLCVIVVAIAQGVLLAGGSLHPAAWEVCMCVCVYVQAVQQRMHAIWLAAKSLMRSCRACCPMRKSARKPFQTSR